MLLTKEVQHQTLAVSTVALNRFLDGIVEGWIAPTIHRLQQPDSELQLTIGDSSWIASASYIGMILGSTIAALALDVVGRKGVATGCAIIYVLIWLGVTFSNTVWLLCCTRFLLGMSYAATLGVDTFYLGEVASTSVRGVFGTLIQCLYYMGVCVEYVAVTYLSFKATALFNAALALLAAMSALWMVESPHYLLLKGNRKHALRNFLYLKGVPDLGPYDDEFQRIKHNVDFERTKITSYKAILTSSGNRRALLIVLLLQLLFSATGYGTVMSYSSTLFSSTERISQYEFTILFGVSQLGLSLLAILFMRRYNRRAILRTSFCFIALSQLCTAALLYAHEKVTPLAHFPWLIFASINTYVCANTLAFPAIYMYRGELLPLSIKAFGGFAVSVCRAITNFVLILQFFHISRSYGTHVNFILYSLVSVVFVVFLYFFVPETRNKSLTQIQDNLHNRKVPNTNGTDNDEGI